MSQLFLSTQPGILLSAGMAGPAMTQATQPALDAGLLSSELSLDAMEGGLAERLGAANVHRLSRDVVTYGGGMRRHLLQRVPGPGEQPTFDFTQLVSKTDPTDPPVLLYRPDMRSSYISFMGWIGALRSFGHDIRIIDKRETFKAALAEEKPDVVCISAYETQLQELSEAYRDLTELRPEAVTILGGYAALPAASRFFDIVVPGEGDLVLPMLLNFLHAAFADGGYRVDSAADGEVQPRYATDERTRALRSLRGRRISAKPDGLSEVEVDFGRQLLLWPEGGTADPTLLPQAPRKAWPIPISDMELATVFRMPSVVASKQLDHARIYTQRGCPRKVEERCGFCSITSPPGRRMATADVLAMIADLSARGLNTIVINDEDFMQNRVWVTRFFDGLEALNLPSGTHIVGQTRADRWSEDLVLRAWDLGMQIDVGLETFHPDRAERLGKARPGEGARYVERGEELIKLASRYARDNDRDVRKILQVYMIGAARGDSFHEIMRDQIAQLWLIGELRKEGCPEPRLSYSIDQLPFRMSRSVRETLPDVRLLDETRASALEIESGNGKLVANLGAIEGTFHPFATDGRGEMTGMIEGRSFRHAPLLAKYLAGLRHELTELNKRHNNNNGNSDAAALVSATTLDFFYASFRTLVHQLPQIVDHDDNTNLLNTIKIYSHLFEAAFVDKKEKSKGEGGKENL